ncbi:MAG: chemotaxis protein CheW [Thermodesulfobacteriota bacterium]|nr:chemotaxis protein CheW [Thermodesulfobacteriota bacterium]
MNISDESLAELFEQYKEEVKETIELLDMKIVAAEQDPTNSEIIFSLFRHLHSLKGSSKMFNVENIGHIAHKLEDLMHLIDQDNSILGRFPKIVDLLFQGNDIFREVITRLEEDITYVNLTPAHARFIEQINHQLNLLDKKENMVLEQARVLLDELESVLPLMEDMETAGVIKAMKDMAGGISLWAMKKDGGNVRYTYGGHDFTEFISAYQSELERLKSGASGPEDIEAFMKNIDDLLQAIFEVAEEDIMGVLQELNDGLEMFQERSLEVDPIVIEFFSALLDDLKEHVKAEAVGEVESLSEEVVEIEAHVPRDAEVQVSAQAGGQVKTIRVDERKIDQFLDSVGRLITQSEILNHLQYSFRKAGINPVLVRDFAAINRSISNDIIGLQKSIMEVRQVEMNNILKKFPRLVRDISRKMNKEVELVISGERTPIDKSLLDDVEKTLLHIVRNAVDHGLETPEERVASGKEPRGRIGVKVEHQEDLVLIEVADDGRGIDFKAVREKAFQRGAITREQYETMSDEESESLIFQSGLTTKMEATDISGRGVGLDVVMSNIRKWNGEVSLASRPGRGLTVRLSIPVTDTLLTKEAIMLQLSDLTFCLPLEYVVEIVTIPEQDVHRHKALSLFRHRDRIVDVIDIKGLLGIQASDGGKGRDKTFIILRDRTEKGKAIAADEILGQQKIVVKDFDMEDFRRLPYCQGLSLLGDGRVVLVLDGENIVG